jgi:arylsulfatase B
MNRRYLSRMVEALQGALRFIPLLTVFCASISNLASAPQNILLIIADDYGIDSCSLYNTNIAASQPPTTNLTALAKNGILFRNAYSNPVCSPTRACLITGRYGFRTGIGDVIMGPGSSVLTAPEITLPEVFGANPSLGYQLAHFGKWHLNNNPTSPNSIGGWPHYAGNLLGALTSYTNWTKTVDGVSTANYTNYATTDIVNDAVAWIQSQGTKPWFAWVAFNAPHTPFHKPPSSLCPHYANLSGTQQNINNNPRPYFEAMVEAMDLEMGRLLAAVDRTNTHIIFLGDNGTPGQVIQPPYSSSRAKDSLYEGGIRVPLVISSPGVKQPGRTNNTLVNAVDLFSTILELAGIDATSAIPASTVLDSKSLAALLATNATLERFAYAEKFGINTASPDGRCLRNSSYKLIRWDDAREEFYDVGSDPYETINLLAAGMNPIQQANYYSLEMKLGDFQTKLGAPTILSSALNGAAFTTTVQRNPTNSYALWRAYELTNLAWAPVSDAIVLTNGSNVSLVDTNYYNVRGFYRVQASVP